MPRPAPECAARRENALATFAAWTENGQLSRLCRVRFVHNFTLQGMVCAVQLDRAQVACAADGADVARGWTLQIVYPWPRGAVWASERACARQMYADDCALRGTRPESAVCLTRLLQYEQSEGEWADFSHLWSAALRAGSRAADIADMPPFADRQLRLALAESLAAAHEAPPCPTSIPCTPIAADPRRRGPSLATNRPAKHSPQTVFLGLFSDLNAAPPPEDYEPRDADLRANPRAMPPSTGTCGALLPLHSDYPDFLSVPRIPSAPTLPDILMPLPPDFRRDLCAHVS